MAKRPAVFERKTALGVLRATKRVLRSPAGAFGAFDPASIPDVVMMMGKLDGALTAGENSQVVSIWASFNGDAPTDTGVDVEAWGWLLSSDLASGDEVLIVLANGRWEVVGGGGGAAADCNSTLEDAISDDSDNCLTIGTDSRLFVDCTDKVSSDANNLVTAGTDNGALLTAASVIDAEADNALTVGANNKLMLDPVDLIDAETPNGLTIGSNGELHVDPADLIDDEADNLVEAGPDGQLYVDPTNCPRTRTKAFNSTTTQTVTDATETTLVLDGVRGGHADWALDDANDEIDLTGSPDHVCVEVCVTMISNSAAGTMRLRLYRGAATGTEVCDFEVKYGDALTRTYRARLWDFSPGANPTYYVTVSATASGFTSNGTTAFDSFIVAQAVWE